MYKKRNEKKKIKKASLLTSWWDAYQSSEIVFPSLQISRNY